MNSIRLATLEDLDALMRLFAEVKTGLSSIGFDQWPDYYPQETIVSADLSRSEVYCMEANGRMLGTLTLNQEQDPAYEQISWGIAATAPFVVHRLVVHPDYWGQGLGKQWMRFAEERAAQLGGKVIRLDTYAKNAASNALYTNLGYQLAKGACYFYGPTQPFVCFEKAL